MLCDAKRIQNMVFEKMKKDRKKKKWAGMNGFYNKIMCLLCYVLYNMYTELFSLFSCQWTSYLCVSGYDKKKETTQVRCSHR